MEKLDKSDHWVMYNPGCHQSINTWFSFTQYNKPYTMFVPNFKILGPEVPEKSLAEKGLHIYKHTNIFNPCPAEPGYILPVQTV